MASVEKIDDTSSNNLIDLVTASESISMPPSSDNFFFCTHRIFLFYSDGLAIFIVDRCVEKKIIKLKGQRKCMFLEQDS